MMSTFFSDSPPSFKEKIELIVSNSLVDNPPHYQILPGVQAIDVIKATLSKEEFIGYCKGNILKYVLRANLKNKEEDLHKANKYSEYLNEILK